MKPIVFHREARAEARAAAEWYEAQRQGLGAAFRAELEVGLARISRSPEAFGSIARKVRCYRLDCFPFGLVYRIEPRRLFLIAIMHLHRDPDYWKHRVY